MTTEPTTGPSGSAEAPGGPAGWYCGFDQRVVPPTVSYGSTGVTVREAQCLLLALGYNVGHSGIDGVFGPGTRSAVRAFQSDYGLLVDGIVGPRTWNGLRYY
ncbi:peptidoglycan-binding domain-containing protein [Streptomyces sp. NPDC005012]|uniref:peptidoglycan-binding domain-containing protein n=1 Tax=unclassified Streptomyces TaxID=2593676 RepID=UPI0033A0378E